MMADWVNVDIQKNLDILVHWSLKANGEMQQELGR